MGVLDHYWEVWVCEGGAVRCRVTWPPPTTPPGAGLCCSLPSHNYTAGTVICYQLFGITEASTLLYYLYMFIGSLQVLSPG